MAIPRYEVTLPSDELAIQAENILAQLTIRVDRKGAQIVVPDIREQLEAALAEVNVKEQEQGTLTPHEVLGRTALEELNKVIELAVSSGAVLDRDVPAEEQKEVDLIEQGVPSDAQLATDELKAVGKKVSKKKPQPEKAKVVNTNIKTVPLTVQEQDAYEFSPLSFTNVSDELRNFTVHVVSRDDGSELKAFFVLSAPLELREVIPTNMATKRAENNKRYSFNEYVLLSKESEEKPLKDEERFILAMGVMIRGGRRPALQSKFRPNDLGVWAKLRPLAQAVDASKYDAFLNSFPELLKLIKNPPSEAESEPILVGGRSRRNRKGKVVQNTVSSGGAVEQKVLDAGAAAETDAQAETPGAEETKAP